MLNVYTAEGGEARASVQVPLLVRTLTTEVAGDFSLPDYQPEIKRLLRIGVNLLPPNAFPSGSGVELGGTLDYYVLYMGHDGGLYCAPLSTEYRLSAEADPHACPAGVGEPVVCLCDGVADTPVGRVTAPRRLHIRCKLKSEVSLYGECPLPEEWAREDAPERLMGEATVGRVYGGIGERLTLQDDLLLPPAEGELRVICAEGQVMVTEATPAEGLVNCRGEVTVKLTLCPAEPPTDAAPADGDEVALPRGESPRPTVLWRKIPFAQAVELEGVSPACGATARGYCTELAVEMEEGHIHLDLGVITEVRAQENRTVSFVKDLYSTSREGSCRFAPYPVEVTGRALCGNFTLSDSLPLSEVGMDAAARVVDVIAQAVPETLTPDPAKGRCILTGVCRCQLLLSREGEYTSLPMELPFRYELEEPTLSRGEADAPPSFNGGVTVVNCRARMDGERVGVDAELAVSLRVARPAPLTLPVEVSFGEAVSRPVGEYVICFPAPDDTLWSVAKRYHAPLAALTAANELSCATPADSPDSLQGVGYLIV